MAYVEDNSDNEDEIGGAAMSAKAANASTPSSDDSALSTSGSGLVTGTSTGTSGASTPTPTKATDPTQSGWTNLSAYLDANSDQAAQMGSKVGARVNDQATIAQNSLNDLSGAFSTQSNAGGINLANQQSTIDAAVADPTTYANDPTNYNQIRSDLSGAYSGPNQLQDLGGYSKVANNLNTAQSSLGLTGTEAGRDQLLQSTYQRPDYTQGQRNLDQLLLENNSSAQNSISGLQDRWAGLGAILNQATSNAQGLAAQNRQSSIDTASYANKALTNAAATQNTAIKNQVATDISNDAATSANSTAMRDAINRGQLTSAQAAILGMTGDTNTYGVDANAFLNYQNGAGATSNNVVTSDQAARVNALNSMLGQGNTYNPDPKINGSYRAATLTGDQSGFQAAIAAAQAQADAKWNAANQTQNFGAATTGDAAGFANNSWAGLQQAINPGGSYSNQSAEWIRAEQSKIDAARASMGYATQLKVT